MTLYFCIEILLLVLFLMLEFAALEFVPISRTNSVVAFLSAFGSGREAPKKRESSSKHRYINQLSAFTNFIVSCNLKNNYKIIFLFFLKYGFFYFFKKNL